MWLAKMLVAAARKEMNNAPIKLNLEYPSIPEVRSIVPRLADAFRQAGVEIVPIEVPLLAARGRAALGQAVRPGLSRAQVRRAGARGRVACFAPAMTPRPRPTHSLRPPARDPSASLAARARRRLAHGARAWRSRSIASRATSCRSFRSGSSPTITPGEID